MNDLKSIAYAFIANGVQLYISDDNEIIITKLVCRDCGENWYTNLTECFLCGSINSFLFRCRNCGNYQSITKSSGGCSYCKNEDLFYDCANLDCISNTNDELKNEIHKKGGVFNKNSGMLISLQYCLNCGSKINEYKFYKINVITLSSLEHLNNIDFNPDIIAIDNSFTIIKFKSNDKVNYCLIKSNELGIKTFSLSDFTDNFSNIVHELFPIRK